MGYLDRDYSTHAETIEQVIERCAGHGRQSHGLKSFGTELYAKMRPHIYQRDDAAPAT